MKTKTTLAALSLSLSLCAGGAALAADTPAEGGAMSGNTMMMKMEGAEAKKPADAMTMEKAPQGAMTDHKAMTDEHKGTMDGHKDMMKMEPAGEPRKN